MAEVGDLTVKVNVDSAEALARIKELRAEAEPLSELLTAKRDWAPYALGAAGWLFALIEWITR